MFYTVPNTMTGLPTMPHAMPTAFPQPMAMMAPQQTSLAPMYSAAPPAMYPYAPAPQPQQHHVHQPQHRAQHAMPGPFVPMQAPLPMAQLPPMHAHAYAAAAPPPPPAMFNPFPMFTTPAAAAPVAASSPAVMTSTPLSLGGLSLASRSSLSTPSSVPPAFAPEASASTSADAMPLVMPPAPAAIASLKIPPQGIKLDGTLLLSSETNRPILADRFRTKKCRNHTADRSCPYRMRCMFAHTDDEMRTPEQNFRDGLYTEAAIRAYQERESAARRRQRGPRAQNSPGSTPLGADSTNSGSQAARSSGAASSSSSSSHNLLSAVVAAPIVMNAPPALPMPQLLPGAFIHQPYAPRPLQ